MAHCIIEQQQPLCATILEVRKVELLPTDSEFSVLVLFVQVMKPLVDTTEVLGAQKLVKVSTLRPILHKLLDSHFLPGEQDSQPMKDMRKVMKKDLHERYTGETLQFLTKAAFLDPRMKKLKFLSRDERTEVSLLIESEAELMSDSQGEMLGISEEPLAKKSEGEKKLLELLCDLNESDDGGEDLSTEEKIKSEVTRYAGEEHTSMCPLNWWKENRARYPLLSHLASKYLAMSE